MRTLTDHDFLKDCAVLIGQVPLSPDETKVLIYPVKMDIARYPVKMYIIKEVETQNVGYCLIVDGAVRSFFYVAVISMTLTLTIALAQTHVYFPVIRLHNSYSQPQIFKTSRFKASNPSSQSRTEFPLIVDHMNTCILTMFSVFQCWTNQFKYNTRC